MRIGDIVNVKNESGWEDSEPFWRGKVTGIHNNGREITIQDKGINFAVIDIDKLKFKHGEYWEE